MKKAILLILAIILYSSGLYAQSYKGWIDVTDTYLADPRFENDSEGWDIECKVANTRVVYGGLEFWSGWFKISQAVSVPNGKYRLSMQAYYRTADDETAYWYYSNGRENLTAYFYANESEAPVASVYSEYLTEKGVGGYYTVVDKNDNACYYPASVDAGAYCFRQDMYNNSLEVNITDGTLSLGIYCWEYQSGNWCMMDNFKLEYYGTITPASKITLSQSTLSLIEGDSRKLTATILPTNATFLAPEWSSADESIATVDQAGVVTAHRQGETYIYATAKDKNGVSEKCKVTVTRSVATSASIVINEIQAANIDMFVDPSFNYGGWVELYNPTAQSVGLRGLYISDDKDNLTKHRLNSYGIMPAGGYHVLWFDHYHHRYTPTQIDFKLDYDGGTIYISDPDGKLITSCDYPPAFTRTSYARTVDAGTSWGYTAEPTPGSSNAKSTFASERTEAPIVDTDAKLFISPFTVKVSIPSGATLRYTTDGTTPTLTNGNTSANGIFQVRATTTYRFRLFEEGKLPSQVITRSYLYKDWDHTLPVISVVTNPDNLYDDSLGVYIRGVNGRPGNGQSTPCNWNMDWDRPVNFEYITPEGGMVVNQEVDFAMCGGWSRANEPHSFKLKAGKIYEGKNSIDYPFFPSKPYLKHKTLQNRNGGNDYSCRIKDAALQEIVHRSGLEVEGQHTQPIVHLINGEYIGLLNMREPNNKHYAYANWGIDTDEMDQFEMSPDSGYVQMEGTRDAFLEWYALSANAADADTYEAIRELVDIDEYINYMAVELFLGGADWPHNNVKGFRSRGEGGRFRFVLFDLDGALNLTSPFYSFEKHQTHTFNTIYETGEAFTEEIELVTIFLNMLANESFRKQFIDSYCLVAGSVFEPSRCNEIIDEMAERIAPALDYEGHSPYSTANTMKSALANRQNTLINAMVNYSRFELYRAERYDVSISANITDAPLRLNGMPIPTSTFSGALFAPITLRAEDVAGYRFVGWGTENSVKQNTLIKFGSAWKYYDLGSLDGKQWTSSSYSVSSWDEGKAPLGYYTSDANNSRGYNTTLSYGNDASNKRPTYYFRSSVTLSATPAADDVFTLRYTVDDGMVVYVNGTEVTRYLMPNGTVSYSSYATTYASGNPDSGTISLPASLFKKGENIIAVEVHNNSASSTDIYFDAELLHASSSVTSHIISTDREYTLVSDITQLKAMYEQLPEEEQSVSNYPVRINEISADNSIYVNEYYKKNDWIELYNTTSQPVDVAGMYLSDNLSKLTKYQIPSEDGISTVIEPYGHLIIWADKLAPVTQLHTTFKLAAEGGSVALTAADKSWSDILHYEPHLGIESVGLYPDGSSDVYVMSTPTIAKPNRINSYAAWLGQSSIGNSVESAISDEEQMALAYRERILHITGAESAWADVTVYTSVGEICVHITVNTVAGYASVNLSALPQGIYIVAVTDSNGDTQTIKIGVE